MACRHCGSTATPEMGDDRYYCSDCGSAGDLLDPDSSDGVYRRSREQLGSEFDSRGITLGREQIRQQIHNSRARSDSYESWILPIKDMLDGLASNQIADRSFDLVRRANRVRQLSSYRKGLRSLVGIGNRDERTAHRQLMFALASIDVLSEVEMADYGADSLFLEHGIPPHDRNWAVKILRPPRGFVSKNEDDISNQVMRNAFQRGKQIARWLTAIEQHLRDIFNEEDSNRVMHKAKEIIREEWLQPASEGEFYGLTPQSNFPPRRLTMGAVLESMTILPGFTRRDRTDLWDAFPVKGITKDSIR